MLDYLHPKVHLAIGGSIFVISIIISKYMVNFYLFLLFYSICAGIGYGIIYILPLKNAWLFFPNRKGMVGGIILSSHSFAAIGWSFFTVHLINPENEIPNLYINVGNSLEVLFSVDSTPPHNVPYCLEIVGYTTAVLLIFAVIFIYKKSTVSFDKELA